MDGSSDGGLGDEVKLVVGVVVAIAGCSSVSGKCWGRLMFG